MTTQRNVCIYKRKSKTGFTYTYSIEAGKNPKTGKRQRVTKSGFKTAKDARIAAQPILNKLLLGENIIESNVTFGEYAKQWISEQEKKVKATTLCNLKTTIIIANKYFKYTKLKDITKYAYQQFIDDYSIGKKFSTIIIRHNIIKNIFSSAYKNNLIRYNPTNNIRIPR